MVMFILGVIVGLLTNVILDVHLLGYDNVLMAPKYPKPSTPKPNKL